MTSAVKNFCLGHSVIKYLDFQICMIFFILMCSKKNGRLGIMIHGFFLLMFNDQQENIV